MLVDSASCVIFECRSLERCVSRQRLPLAPGAPSREPPSQAQREYVERVVAEWEQEDYWFHASKDGNREAHYRGTSGWMRMGGRV